MMTTETQKPLPVAMMVTTAEQLAEAHRLRIEVFVTEQGFTITDELDDIDAKCTHWILIPYEHATATSISITGKAIGAIRLVPSATPHTASLGRLCLATHARNKGYAKRLVNALHAHAKETGITTIKITSQMNRVQFYEKRGYVVVDPVPMMVDGAPHISMIKHLGDTVSLQKH